MQPKLLTSMIRDHHNLVKNCELQTGASSAAIINQINYQLLDFLEKKADGKYPDIIQSIDTNAWLVNFINCKRGLSENMITWHVRTGKIIARYGTYKTDITKSFRLSDIQHVIDTTPTHYQEAEFTDRFSDLNLYKVNNHPINDLLDYHYNPITVNIKRKSATLFNLILSICQYTPITIKAGHSFLNTPHLCSKNIKIESIFKDGDLEQTDHNDPDGWMYLAQDTCYIVTNGTIAYLIIMLQPSLILRLKSDPEVCTTGLNGMKINVGPLTLNKHEIANLATAVRRK